MIQIPVWQLPYWGTACLLCLAYLPMGWLLVKLFKHCGSDSPWCVLSTFGLVLLIMGMFAYVFCPGFYFYLSLRDVQWAYLETK